MKLGKCSVMLKHVDADHAWFFGEIVEADGNGILFRSRNSLMNRDDEYFFPWGAIIRVDYE